MGTGIWVGKRLGAGVGNRVGVKVGSPRLASVMVLDVAVTVESVAVVAVIVIVFDVESESFNLLPRAEARALGVDLDALS